MAEIPSEAIKWKFSGLPRKYAIDGVLNECSQNYIPLGKWFKSMDRGRHRRDIIAGDVIDESKKKILQV